MPLISFIFSPRITVDALPLLLHWVTGFLTTRALRLLLICCNGPVAVIITALISLWIARILTQHCNGKSLLLYDL